ncbi:MAG: hypothetical protein JWL61_3742 [Gemmatimonadetes bacterium]|nr:hypothetical protein [Gemmatimonadota bacterium]
MRLGIIAYTASDSVGTDGSWVTRDARIASNVGSTVTALAAGTTYIVATVANHGHTFLDSVRVTVTQKAP